MVARTKFLVSYLAQLRHFVQGHRQRHPLMTPPPHLLPARIGTAEAQSQAVPTLRMAPCEDLVCNSHASKSTQAGFTSSQCTARAWAHEASLCGDGDFLEHCVQPRGRMYAGLHAWC